VEYIPHINFVFIYHVPEVVRGLFLDGNLARLIPHSNFKTLASTNKFLACFLQSLLQVQLQPQTTMLIPRTCSSTPTSPLCTCACVYVDCPLPISSAISCGKKKAFPATPVLQVNSSYPAPPLHPTESLRHFTKSVCHSTIRMDLFVSAPTEPGKVLAYLLKKQTPRRGSTSKRR
jgi:hypothetical protein